MLWSALPVRRPVLLYQAEWPLLGDGVCRQARRQAVTLAQAGLRVGVVGIGYKEESAHPAAAKEIAGLRYNGSARTPAAIRQTVIHNPKYLRDLLSSRSGIGPKQSIVATWWERDRAHRDTVSVLRDCAELWVTCERNRTAFATSGVPADRVRVVPYPLPDSHPAQAAPIPTGKRFYNIGKWEPRKNQAGLIGAFLHAYRPGDGATLTIKTSTFGTFKHYPGSEKALAQWSATGSVRARGWTEVEIARHVQVLTRSLEDREIDALHADNNIYVSASYGEALDIPALEAKSAGNRLVHVGFGGSEDYAEPGDVQVPWRLGPVDPHYGWEPGAQWATYDAQALVAALAAASPRSDRSDVPTLAGYRAAAVGQLMRDRIQAVFGVKVLQELSE